MFKIFRPHFQLFIAVVNFRIFFRSVRIHLVWLIKNTREFRHETHCSKLLFRHEYPKSVEARFFYCNLSVLYGENDKKKK